MDSCLNALPTRKVLKFLSRLNEMSGGKENTVFSFGIIVEKVLKVTFLMARFLWMVGEGE